jgi:hypothetical protein
MSYCTCNDVRAICGLSRDDISDSDLASLRDLATAQLNADIGYRVEDEEVRYIDSEKQNKIDGSNTVFYAKAVHNSMKEIGDYDDDGSVDEDDIYAYTINEEGTRTVYTVSSLDSANLGKFTLASAPSTSEVLFITYVVFPIKASSNLIKVACSQLAAAYAFTQIDAVKLQAYRIGKVAVSKQRQGFSTLNAIYNQTIDRINASALTGIATNVTTDIVTRITDKGVSENE